MGKPVQILFVCIFLFDGLFGDNRQLIQFHCEWKDQVCNENAHCIPWTVVVEVASPTLFYPNRKVREEQEILKCVCDKGYMSDGFSCIWRGGYGGTTPTAAPAQNQWRDDDWQGLNNDGVVTESRNQANQGVVIEDQGQADVVARNEITSNSPRPRNKTRSRVSGVQSTIYGDKCLDTCRKSYFKDYHICYYSQNQTIQPAQNKMAMKCSPHVNTSTNGKSCKNGCRQRRNEFFECEVEIRSSGQLTHDSQPCSPEPQLTQNTRIYPVECQECEKSISERIEDARNATKQNLRFATTHPAVIDELIMDLTGLTRFSQLKEFGHTELQTYRETLKSFVNSSKTLDDLGANLDILAYETFNKAKLLSRIVKKVTPQLGELKSKKATNILAKRMKKLFDLSFDTLKEALITFNEKKSELQPIIDSFDGLERKAKHSMNLILKSLEEPAHQTEYYDFSETNNSEIPISQIDTQLPNNYTDAWIKCEAQFKNALPNDKRNIRDQMRKIKFVSSVLVSLGSLVENVHKTERMIELHMDIVENWQSYVKQMDADDLLTSGTLLQIAEDEDFKDKVLTMLQNLKQSCQKYRQVPEE